MPPFANKRSLILKELTLLAEEEKNCRIILRGKLTKPNPNFQLNLFCFKGLYISKTIYKTRPRKTIFRVKTLKKNFSNNQSSFTRGVAIISYT